MSAEVLRAEVFLDLIVLIGSADPVALAAEAGISPSTIRNWLNGRTLSPRLNTLLAVADALGYDLRLVRRRARLRRAA